MRAGYALPDITFYSDGLDIHVHALPFSYANPPISFEIEAQEYISAPIFADQIQDFIEDVIEHLREEDVPETNLERRWTMVEASRADPDERDFCEAAAALGIDPYLCDEASAELIERAGQLFEGEALYELLAGSERPALESSLAWVREVEHSDRGKGGLPTLRDFKGAGRHLLRARRPWNAGYGAAKKLRSDMGLTDRRPVPTVSDLGGLFGNPDFTVTPFPNEIVRATVLETTATPVVRLGPRNHPSSELFAMARAIGDLVCYGDAERFPVMENYGTRRQRVGRAFAAEFLAPGQAVSEMTEVGRTEDEIAAHFGVSPLVIQHQLENSVSGF
jgi:hypothetical protein